MVRPDFGHLARLEDFVMSFFKPQPFDTSSSQMIEDSLFDSIDTEVEMKVEKAKTKTKDMSTA